MVYDITILEKNETRTGYSIIWIVEEITPTDSRNTMLFYTKDEKVISNQLQEMAEILYGK